MTHRLRSSPLLALLLVLGACQHPGPAPGAPATLRIGYSRLRISLPVFVAQERGIFARHGIHAELQMYDTAQPLMQALVEGRVDVAGYTALPIAFNGMLRSGTPLYFLTAMVEDDAHPISYLLRRKAPDGAAPTLRRVEDLRGRRVGILPTVAYRAWLRAILTAHHVPIESVVVQPIAPLMQAEALAAGGVDALFTNDPAATAALASGTAERLTTGAEVPRVMGSPFLFGSFNVRKRWGDARPGTLERLRAALDEAVVFVNAHPEQARQAMAPYLPERFRTQVSSYPDARYLTSEELTESALQAQAAGALEHGIMPRALDLGGLVLGAP
ncbi:MAG: ABC transporter substrate-binding protein [Deltaproteobacteria bacterium]|nr:ABC transporter substrate-binding protein [Deltaproteobacteria bacterium]